MGYHNKENDSELVYPMVIRTLESAAYILNHKDHYPRILSITICDQTSQAWLSYSLTRISTYWQDLIGHLGPSPVKYVDEKWDISRRAEKPPHSMFRQSGARLNALWQAYIGRKRPNATIPHVVRR